MNPIRDRWESYARQVLPPDAPEVQVIECRRAFYGGCAAMLDLVVRASDLDDESAFRKMDRLSAELKAFIIAVAQGKA